MAQTEAETRKLEDYRPNHSLDRIGTYIRLGLMGVSVLFAAYIGIRQVNEQAQPNEPQPAYEHAFVEGDEEEPKVGDIYYQERKQSDDIVTLFILLNAYSTKTPYGGDFFLV